MAFSSSPNSKYVSLKLKSASAKKESIDKAVSKQFCAFEYNSDLK